jgi:hypothetical protein
VLEANKMRKNEAKRSLEAFDEATRWIHSIAVATGDSRTLVVGKSCETQFSARTNREVE